MPRSTEAPRPANLDPALLKGSGHSEPNSRGAGNLIPGGKPHQKILRRRFKVDRLPPKAQAAVFRGYTRGDTYKKIQEDVKRLGGYISEGSLSRYWGAVWLAEHERLRQSRANLALLKNALQLDPNSPSGQLAQELLYTIVFQKIPQIEQEGPLPLLREAREQEKVEATAKGHGSKAKTTPGKGLKHHLEQLYGPGVVVEEEVDASDPDNETR